MAFESTVIDTVKHLKDAGLKLHFVFNGLESGVGRDPVTCSTKAAQFDSEAFNLYEAEQAKKARDLFQESGALPCTIMVKFELIRLSGLWYPSALSEILKKTLHEQGIAFTVAPYSALGQVRPDGPLTQATLTT